MFHNKTMRLKLRAMKELRRFLKKKSKKKLAKKLAKFKSGKKRITIKKIFKLRNKKFRKTQKGGVNFQLFTDITRSGLNEANGVQNTFLGNN